MRPSIFELLDRIESEAPTRSGPVVVPTHGTSLDLLQGIYRDPEQPQTTRLRAAALAIPYEHVKHSVVANVHSFAAQMEEIARQRGRSNVIDAKPNFQKVEVLKETD